MQSAKNNILEFRLYMSLLVQKFGGTSIGTVEKIEAVAEKICDARKRGDDIAIVVSAMSGETNRLIALANGIQKNPSSREMDVLVSTGEQVTIALLCMALHKRGCAAKSYIGSQVRILTDSAHSKARIEAIDSHRMEQDLDEGKVIVVAGFQGVDERGNITTLGRGGSDTTAVALAAALKADECQIYTDVDGVYTTDPRVVKNARRLDHITFEEMLEMASQGSKVLQIRAVEFAGKYKIPLRVLSSFKEGPGTLITLEDDDNMEKPVVSGIAFNRDEAKLTVRGIPDVPGSAARILGAVGRANIEVDVIVQNVAQDKTASLTFTVHRDEMKNAEAVLNKVAMELGATSVEADANIAKLALVGVGMRSHAGVAATMFSTLGRENINIQMISTSEIKITVVIAEDFLDLAVRSLHSVFELDDDARPLK
jgi:aspartate kinase